MARDLLSGPQRLAAFRRAGRVSGVLIADAGDFTTRPVSALAVDLDGIVGDHHHGALRASGGREPWYRRGTRIRNLRSISLVAGDELAAMATALSLAAIRPEWIGANIVIDGIPRLTLLPAGTRLFFGSGAVLVVTALNLPCRRSGTAIARHCGGGPDLALAFARKTRQLRGVVAVVERAGAIADGDEVSAHVPAQWIYAG